MDDETEVTPTAEVTPAPAPEPSQPETEETNEAPVEESSELDALLKQAVGSEEDSPDELVDVEYEGETFRLPPVLKDALLRQSDYTKKTMKLAEQSKAVEALKTEIETVHRATNEEFQAAVMLRTIDERISAYQMADTSGWSQEDFNSARIDLAELNQQRTQIENDLRNRVSERTAQESQKTAKLRDDAIAGAAKVVPNFNDTRRAELESLAVNLGIPSEDAQTIIHPAVYKILHLADIGKKFVESRQKASQVKAAAQAAPVPELGGKAPARVDPENLSTKEWMDHRNKQLRK